MMGAASKADGKVALFHRQRQRLYPQDTIPQESGMLRIFENGRIDPSFQVSIGDRSEAIIYDILAVGDRLWVAGGFEQINGEPVMSLAAMDNGNSTDFQGWMAASAFLHSGELSREGDPDHDGSTNFEEYLAGTDPFDSASSMEASLIGELSWEVPVNPDVTGWERVVEVSSDLVV